MSSIGTSKYLYLLKNNAIYEQNISTSIRNNFGEKFFSRQSNAEQSNITQKITNPNTYYQRLF